MPMRRPNRTLGPGHDEFWAWCDREELRLPECTRCGDLAWPIVSPCVACGGSGFAWRRLGGGGTVAAACTFEKDYYGGTLPLPHETILVALDEGPMFVSNPAGASPGEDLFGARVRVTFVTCEDDAGPFKLPMFARA